MNPNDLPFSLPAANELCHSLPLVTSPQSISKILASVELCKEEERVIFLEELIGLLSKCSCNQLALIQNNLPTLLKSPEDFDLLLYLIESIMKPTINNTHNKKLYTLQVKLFKLLLNFGIPRKRHYEKVYELLSSSISLCRKEGDATRRFFTLQTATELLQQLSLRQVPANEPLCYFYFLPKTCGLAATIPPKTPWPFHRGFTVMMVVKPDAPGVLNGSSQALFKLCASDAVVECCLKDYNMMYIVKSNTLSFVIPIGKLLKDQWVFLSVAHNENSCFSVFLGLEERQYTVEYPKFSEDAELIEETFFSDFLGMANSVMVYKEALPSADVKSVAAGLPTGVCTEKHAQILKALHTSSQCSAWTSFNTVCSLAKNLFEHRQITSALLLGSAGTYLVDGGRYFDSVKNVVPLFRVATLLDLPLAQKSLESALRLCFLYLKPLLSEPHLAFRFNKESKCFVRVLGLHLLRLNPRAVTEGAIKHLARIAELSPLVQKRVLKMVMVTANFWLNIPSSLTSMFWETVKAAFSTDSKEYSKVVNAPAILNIMESVSSDLEVSCCSNHNAKPGTAHHSLSEFYSSMKSFLKLILNQEENIEDFNHVMLLLHKKVCGCLKYNLIVLLKELSESQAAYARAFYETDELHKVFKAARDSPVDIKIACIELADVLTEQLKDNVDIRRFQEAFASMCGDAGAQRYLQEEAKEAKLQYATSVFVAADPRLSTVVVRKEMQKRLARVNSTELVESQREKTEKRSSSCKAKAETVQKVVTEEVKLSPLVVKKVDRRITYVDDLRSTFLRGSDTSFLLFDHLSESRVAPQLAESVAEPQHNDLSAEAVYSSVFLWLVGSRPSLVSRTSKVLSTSQGGKPKIGNPHVLPILITLVKAFNKENLNKKCLIDLSILAEADSYNKKLMFSCEELLKWLLHFEASWYGKLLNYHNETQYGIEILKIAFILHLSILCEELQSAEENVMRLFLQHISAMQRKTLHKRRDPAIVLQCLKYLWFKVMKIILLPTQGSIEIDHIQALIKITLNLMIGMSSKSEGKLVKKIRLLDSNCKGSEPLLQFHVSDSQLIEHIIESICLSCQYNGKPLTSTELKDLCKEQVLDDHIKLLDSKQKKGMQYLGKENKYTNHIVLLLGIAFKNTLPENAGKISKLAEQLGHYIGLLGEYAGKKGYRRLGSGEGRNFLLVVSVLLHECANVEKMAVRSHAKEVVRAASSLLLYAFQTAEEVNGVMKEVLKKVFGPNKHKSRVLFENIHSNAKTDNAELDIEYKMLYNDYAAFSASLARISDASLDILRNDLKNENRVMLETGKGRKQTGAAPASWEAYNPVPKLVRDCAAIANWGRKWKKAQREVKQWQGAWRNKSLFNGNKNLPLKVSGHVFSNGLRCVTKVRSKKTMFISPGKCPASSLDLFNDECFFECMASITREKNNSFNFLAIERIKELNLIQGRNFSIAESCKLDDELSNVMHGKVPLAMRELVTVPTECEVYTAFLVKKGKIMIYYSRSKEKFYIVFALDNKASVEEDERVMFNYEYTRGKPLIHKWKMRNIRGIFKKYIVDKESALEMIVKDKSLLFNFQTREARDFFHTRLLKLQERLKVVFELPLGLEKSLTDDWVNYKVSTFDYLLMLNHFAGRSFNNSSQYPIFPWVIVSASPTLNLANSHIYRDLSKNMGMFGDKDRAEAFKKRFDKITIPALGNFHFAAHYSSPAITFQYFMRLFPFLEAYIQLFSGLDNPNRMFHSIQESLEISRNDPSDVKELVPEFFCLPEMFINNEKLHFGKREADNQLVDDVVLPAWAQGSPYTFVELMKTALESDWVSGTINRWIDLVFGYKQRGKEAEKAFNVFTTLSQDPAKVLEQVKEEEKKAFQTQAYQWGQTPTQLFTKPHPARVVKHSKAVYSLFDLNAAPCIYEGKKLAAALAERVIGVFVMESDVKSACFVIVTLNGSILECSVELAGGSEESMIPQFGNVQEKTYDNGYLDSDLQLLNTSIEENFPIVCVKGGKPYLVQGGYVDGTMQFTQLDNLNKTSKVKVHGGAVKCIKIDKYEKMGISGSITGEVVLYEINEEMKWEMKRYICDHEGSIADISISSEMLLFCTSGSDNAVNLYTFSGTLLRSFSHSEPIQHILLARSPLPCVVTYARERGTFSCFSLGGKLLCERKNEGKSVVGMRVGRDSCFCEHLVYMQQHLGLSSRKLPTLEKDELEIRKEGDVFELCDNQKMIIIANKDHFAFVWDPHSYIPKHSTSFSIL